MQKKITFTLIIILVGLALFLGYAIYNKTSISSNGEMPSSSIPSPSESMPMTEGSDEIGIFEFPPQDASQEERDRFNSLVLGYAQASDVLDVTGCKVNPLVLKVEYGKTIAVKNSGTFTVVLGYSGKPTLTIEPESTKNVVISEFLEFQEFGRGGFGIGGYSCGGKPGLAGIFYVFSK